MKGILFKSMVVGLFLFCVAIPIGFSHHSTAMFEYTKLVTLKGTIKEMQWLNPHVLIWVDGKIGDEEQQAWVIELTSPGNLTRAGWTKRTFKPGDKVSIDINPLRDGKPAGVFRGGTILNTGQVIPRPGY